MKLVEYYWDHPLLNAYRHDVRKGIFLFRRGEPGTTFFIIIKGLVQLVGHRGGKDYFLHVLEAGQFLGEKMVLSETPHERVFTAQAKTVLTVLELGLKDIEFVRTQAPELMNDILKRMFQIAAERLDRANHLSFILHASDNRERLAQFLLHQAAYVGSPTPQGTEIPLILSEICYHIDIEEPEILAHIAFMEKIGVVKKQSDGCYLLLDLKKLATVGRLLPRQVRPARAIAS